MQFRTLIKTVLYFVKEIHVIAVSVCFLMKNCFSELLHLIRIMFSLVCKLIILQTVFVVTGVTTVNFQPEKKRGMKWLNVYS